MNILKRNIFKAVFFVISIVALIFLFISAGQERGSEPSESEAPPNAVYYTVAEYQGKVAVFKNSDKIPFEIFEAYVESFPEHDRERLRSGIKTSSEAELQKIIEDYTS